MFSDTFGLVTSRGGSKPVLTGMSKKCPQVTRMMTLWLKGVSFVQVVGCWVQPVSLKYAAFKEVTVHRMPDRLVCKVKTFVKTSINIICSI